MRIIIISGATVSASLPAYGISRTQKQFCSALQYASISASGGRSNGQQNCSAKARQRRSVMSAGLDQQATGATIAERSKLAWPRKFSVRLVAGCGDTKN